MRFICSKNFVVFYVCPRWKLAVTLLTQLFIFSTKLHQMSICHHFWMFVFCFIKPSGWLACWPRLQRLRDAVRFQSQIRKHRFWYPVQLRALGRWSTPCAAELYIWLSEWFELGSVLHCSYKDLHLLHYINENNYHQKKNPILWSTYQMEGLMQSFLLRGKYTSKGLQQ